jgi:hypothetical protein
MKVYEIQEKDEYMKLIEEVRSGLIWSRAEEYFQEIKKVLED